MKKFGFTIIELILVIFIFAILSIMGITALRTTQVGFALDNDTQLIFENLTKARQQAIASKNRLPWGVHFMQNSIIVFSGSSFNSSDPNNQTFAISNNSTISNISLGGGSDVIFYQVNGTASAYGTVTVSLNSNPTQNKTITILQSGLIYISSMPSQTSSRITDGRHVELGLIWSIRNSSTLSFVFSKTGQANVRYDIAMSSFFNIDKTSFDWSGSFTPYISPQNLRVHTHFLDATSTSLCIHRRGDQNTDAVQILIDNQTIVSYTSSGQPSKGSAVQTMVVQ